MYISPDEETACIMELVDWNTYLGQPHMEVVVTLLFKLKTGCSRIFNRDSTGQQFDIIQMPCTFVGRYQRYG
jgi:hypothetical protein